MPMCFAASLGGVLTLVGTSTNLLVNGLWMARDQASLGTSICCRWAPPSFWLARRPCG
jgi:hypothetical protein